MDSQYFCDMANSITDVSNFINEVNGAPVRVTVLDRHVSWNALLSSKILLIGLIL